MKRFVPLLLLACLPALAQSDVTSALNLDHLRAKAQEVVDVSLDASTLQLAGSFLSGGKEKGKEKEAKIKKLFAAGLKGIFVRVFEFDKKGQYTDSDLQPVRALLKAPGWSRIIGVDSKADGESAEVWTRTENGKPAGIFVIAAEEKELAVVYLDGPVNLQDLVDLGGSFGIPEQKGAKGVK